MKAIGLGDRGPAVEDIQRRLRSLGYDLGPTGVDGAFFAKTVDAVRAFQTDSGLAPSAVVDDETWVALVDATFTLGDRMLYLRLPHLHGRDVLVLQRALNALGFACGDADGIFGTYCERAVGEFQRNAGLPADGIAGDDTIAAILALRHVWEGKDPHAHSAARVAPARAEYVLARIPFAVAGLDDTGRAIGERVVNLALATTSEARATLVDASQEPASDTRLHLFVCRSGTTSAGSGRPVVRLDPDETFAARLLTAVESARVDRPQVVVEVSGGMAHDEREMQRAAVRLLDGLCFAFD